MLRVLGRALLLAVALTAVAAAGWYLYGGRSRERFEARVEALREAGQPTRFEDLATPPIPDDENGAKALEKAARILEERERADSADELLWKGEYTDEERLRIAAYLRSLAPYFELLEKIPRLPGWRPDMDWSKGVAMMQGLTPRLTEAARLLVARAELDSEENGRTERAASTAALLLDFSRRCQGPFVLGHLVSLNFASGAIQVLRNASRRAGFDPALFRRIVDPKLVGAIPDRGPPPSMLIEERVYFIAYVRAIAGGDAPDPFAKGRFAFLRRPRLYEGACTCLDLLEEAIRRSDATPEDALAASASFEARYGAAKGNEMVQSQGQLQARLFAAYGEQLARLRLARVVMALLEYRHAHREWPGDLSPLGDLPDDPYSGRPFLYERTGPGARIRSAKEPYGTGEDGRKVRGTDEHEPWEMLEGRNLAWTFAE